MRYTLKLLACFIFVLVGGSSLLHANPPHTRFQAIIFDCDGVLLDTESAGMVAIAVPNQFTLTHDFSNL